ncbi:hypothetical protein [Piscirickettsia salmonis]|nr:hypothetical protein [Piscirickettsia salmonis]
MLGDFASLDVQNTYRGSDAYVKLTGFVLPEAAAELIAATTSSLVLPIS